MMKRLISLASLALIVAVTALAPSVAAAAGAPPREELSPEEEAGTTPASPFPSPSGLAIRSSNGYWLLVNSAEGHRVKVEAEGPTGSVAYTVPGSITDGGIHANLGKYGRVNLRWVPNGRVREVRVKCHTKGVRKHFYDAGSYVGTLRFRGGGGFTSVKRHRIAWRRSWYSALGACGYFLSTGEPGAGLVIDAGERGHMSSPVGFSVYRPHVGAKVSYGAHLDETEGRIEITRRAEAEGGTHSLTAAGEYPSVSATFSPPAPFYGTAMFEPSGPEKGTLTGDLGVEFPDHTKVAMPGKGFEAVLRQESINIHPG